MSFVLGICLVVIASVLAGFVGVILPQKVYVKGSTTQAGWDEILGGYQGNLGDEITIGGGYKTYYLYEKPIFIILAVIFIFLTIAYFIIECKNEENYFKNPKVILITRIAFFSIPIVINIVQSIVFGHFAILGLGTFMLLGGGISYGISRNVL